MIEAAQRHDERLESVDLVVALLELMADASRPRPLGEIAAALDTSKPRAHRHLRALAGHGYVRQDAGGGYEAGARLLALGDRARHRLSLAEAARPAMARLRDATDQAVTLSAPVGGEVAIVELVNGRTIVQFAVRPGTVMHPRDSAHGLVAAAFGGIGGGDPERLAAIRARGWATAPGTVMTGVNALATPVFGLGGAWLGTVAIVGSIDAIPADPPAALVARVLEAAAETSERMGWRT